MHIKLNDLFLEMQEQLDRNQAVLDDALLIELVNRIRPNDTRNQDEVQAKFNAFVQAILITPDAASTLQSFVLKLISQYKQTSLYADTGILSLEGFWNQIFQRLGSHFLPLISDESQLQELVRRVFHQYSDQYWLDSIEDKNKMFKQQLKHLGTGDRT